MQKENIMPDQIKTPLDLHAETVESGLINIESKGITAFTHEIIDALSAIKASGDLRWLEYRARLKKFPDISIGDVEKIIASTQEDSTKSKNEDSPERVNVVDELIEMVRSTGTLIMGDDGEPYIDMEKDTHRETHALRSADIRE
jgi:hypothetical protein